MRAVSRRFGLRAVSLLAVAGLLTAALWPAGGAHLVSAFLAPSAPSTDGRLWNAEYFPNVPVVAHDGRTFRFYDDLVKDKIVVVSFIYTSCSNICPLMTARLAQVKELVGERVGRDVVFLSITIDPLIDGPDVLRTYAETYGAGPGWLFLTGEPDDIDLIRRKLGERSRQKAEHRTDVILGNDMTGEWGRDSAFTEIEVLAENIRRMDPAWRAIAREPAPSELSDQAYTLAGTPGAALWAKACASCHTVGGGDRIGPDLARLAQRRDDAWLRRFLAAPDEMRAAGDPIALELDARYPGVRMPNLSLSSADIDDLLAYLAHHGQTAAASTQNSSH